MSTAELATTLEVVHNIAPNYTLRKFQCYWFSLLIYLVMRSRTGGSESNEELYVKRGKLLGLTPEHSAGDDEMVAEEEYTKAWNQFTVSYSLFMACAGADNGNPLRTQKRIGYATRKMDRGSQKRSVLTLTRPESWRRRRERADKERKRADERDMRLAAERKTESLEREIREMRAKLKMQGIL